MLHCVGPSLKILMKCIEFMVQTRRDVKRFDEYEYKTNLFYNIPEDVGLHFKFNGIFT